MARTSIQLIQALRETAERLAQGDKYQWGHMGSCNCGHLAQTTTRYSKGTIHGAAMWRYGDWREQLRDYCPQSGLPLDEIVDQMLDFGLIGKLLHNKRDDVVVYLVTWANLLEEELLSKKSHESKESQHKVQDVLLPA